MLADILIETSIAHHLLGVHVIHGTNGSDSKQLICFATKFSNFLGNDGRFSR